MTIVAGVTAGWMVAPVVADPAPPEVAAVSLSQPQTLLAVQTDLINRAPDPSAAIEAYAKGLASDPNSLALRQAFIQKMIEFGLPAMAETQARDVVSREPKDGVAWGVLAYADAARGQLAAAVTEVSSAADLLPNNEFIQRTAGQILAWYDTVGDLSKIPASVQDTAERVRKLLGDKDAFKQTYQEALAYYKNAKTQATPAGATSSPANTYTNVPPTGAAYDGYDYSAPYTGYAYAAPYGGYAYPYYGYGYPYYPVGYYYGDYCGYWPWQPDFCIGSAFVPFIHHEPDADDFFSFHHGHHDHDRFFGLFGFGHHGHEGFHDGHGGFFGFGGRTGPHWQGGFVFGQGSRGISGLLNPRVTSAFSPGVSSRLTSGISNAFTPGISSRLTPGISNRLTPGISNRFSGGTVRNFNRSPGIPNRTAPAYRAPMMPRSPAPTFHRSFQPSGGSVARSFQPSGRGFAPMPRSSSGMSRSFSRPSFSPSFHSSSGRGFAMGGGGRHR